MALRTPMGRTCRYALTALRINIDESFPIHNNRALEVEPSDETRSSNGRNKHAARHMRDLRCPMTSILARADFASFGIPSCRAHKVCKQVAVAFHGAFVSVLFQLEAKLDYSGSTGFGAEGGIRTGPEPCAFDLAWQHERHDTSTTHAYAIVP